MDKFLHKIPQGIEEIEQIKNKMNKSRKKSNKINSVKHHTYPRIKEMSNSSPCKSGNREGSVACMKTE